MRSFTSCLQAVHDSGQVDAAVSVVQGDVDSTSEDGVIAATCPVEYRGLLLDRLRSVVAKQSRRL